MKFVSWVDSTGIERKFRLLEDAVSPKKIDGALRIFDRYFRQRIRQRFTAGGPGWKPLAESTLEHRRARAMAALERKLGSDVKRQQRSYTRRFGALEQFGLGGYEKPRARAVAALARRLTTVAEFRRLQAGGSSKVTLFEGRSAERQRASLQARIGRAEEKATRGLLGRISGSFKSTIRGGRLVVESEIPWAGVHNDGGKSGHGAEVPARPFLFLDDQDSEVLAGIMENQMLVALSDEG